MNYDFNRKDFGMYQIVSRVKDVLEHCKLPKKKVNMDKIFMSQFVKTFCWETKLYSIEY